MHQKTSGAQPQSSEKSAHLQSKKESIIIKLGYTEHALSAHQNIKNI